MKIAIICYNHFDATIPLGKYLKDVNPESEVHFIFLMSQSFLNVEIFSLKNEGIRNGFINKAKLKEVVDKEIFEYMGNEISFDIFIFNSYKIADLNNVHLLFGLKKKIGKEKYDVLHFVGNNPWVIFLNAILHKFSKIHTLHEPYPFDKDSAYRLLRHRLKIKLLISTGSHIVLPSKISYQRFLDHFKINISKVSVIPFGPFELFRLYADENIKKSSNLILYYGNISAYKGIEVLIEAWKKVSADYPKLRLIIAGNGLFEYNIKLPFPGLELLNRHLSNNEIADLNSRANVVVCPYTSGSQSGVVMTSFAFDNPIIATEVGALPEFVEDGVTGIIIKANNAEQLYEAIIDLLNNPDKIQRLRTNIKNKFLLSEMGWPKIAEQTFDLYLRENESLKN